MRVLATGLRWCITHEERTASDDPGTDITCSIADIPGVVEHEGECVIVGPVTVTLDERGDTDG